MKNDFTEEIKNIENEILALKTASEYVSIRSANYTTTATVQTGLYKITYADGEEPIFSFIQCQRMDTYHGSADPRTPSGNEQVVEVMTSYLENNSPVTTTSSLVIVSNRPVVGFENIG